MKKIHSPKKMLEDGKIVNESITLEELGALTKKNKIKPTLVSTGMKCKLDPGTYLELSVRSSTPLKYWIILVRVNLY